jgi:type VI protein secretion system component Hcp
MTRLASRRTRLSVEALEERLAPAVVDYYLQIDSVQGESRDDGHAASIQIEHWQFDAHGNVNVVGDPAPALAKAVADAVKAADDATKLLQHWLPPADKAPPSLLGEAGKQQLPKFILDFVHQDDSKPNGSKPGKFLEYKFEILIISSSRLGGQTGESVPVEEVSFNYTDVKFEYQGQDSKGKAPNWFSPGKTQSSKQAGTVTQTSQSLAATTPQGQAGLALAGLLGSGAATPVPSAAATASFAVQYRETDFNFASRLLEEEGIFFRQTAVPCQMVVFTPSGVAGDPGGLNYCNTFTCIPAGVVFRPTSITPPPAVQGPQTAIVVGLQGEEIFTDRYGRVKVQFFWNREVKKGESGSDWIRLATNWAGKGWGFVANPRIGQEVIVDFLEGDPDQPIVVGRVYNAEQMPPYGLPPAQGCSGLKTNATPGGEMNSSCIAPGGAN